MYSRNNFGMPVGPAQSTVYPIINSTGGTLTKGTPVQAGSAGMSMIDVSVEAQATATIGVLTADTANGAVGNVIQNGTIFNITSSASPGDVLYIAIDGSLTNISPQIGSNGFVAGDFIVKVGVVAKNQLNPSLLDLIVCFEVVGEL